MRSIGALRSWQPVWHLFGYIWRIQISRFGTIARVRNTQKNESRNRDSGASGTKLKHTQTEHAYKTLKQAILKGQLPEGCFLSEVDIMKRYGIGRTPFREACNRLLHEQLLEVVPRRGFLVAPMSFLQVRDLFEARLLLEGMIAELAVKRAQEGQILELVQLAERISVVEDSSDGCERLIQANSAFHLCLARMTQNSELVKLLTVILERNERFCYVEYRNHRFHWTDLAADHRPIVRAMRKRDPIALREAVIKDIRDAQQITFGQQTPSEVGLSRIGPRPVPMETTNLKA